MSERGHVSEPGGVVVQTEGGDPEPVDVIRRGGDVVLGESISAETGVNQRPAPPTPKVTIGRRFTVSPERLIGIVLYLGLERKNSDDARHRQYRSTCVYRNPKLGRSGMESAKDGARIDDTGPLNRARDRRILVQ